MGLTTTDLIANIKTRGSFPTANDLFTNAEYLAILDDEMLMQVVPLIAQVNEDYFLEYKDHSIVSGTSAYRIPKRAIGSVLRDVQFIDSSGNVTPLVRLFEEDKRSTTQGQLGYYIKGNQVVMSPSPTSSTGTLRLVYIRRPSKFVLTSACAEITDIDTALNQITVSSLPSTITTGTSIDFVQADSPYDLLTMDASVSSASGTTLTFASLPDDLAEGDYICVAGESCVPMLPEEMVPMLVQAALCVCLSAKKDRAAELELQKLQQMKSSMLDLLQPRTKSDDVKIVSRNTILNTFRG